MPFFGKGIGFRCSNSIYEKICIELPDQAFNKESSFVSEGTALSGQRLKRGLHGHHDDYDPALHLKYARPHPQTKVIHAYAQRYAPQAWPKWHTWTMFRWNALTRHVNPYAGQGGQGVGSGIGGRGGPGSGPGSYNF